MFHPKQTVLVDANVIIEAHRSNCWKALADYYSLHTVETVVVETQTGAHNRAAADTIDHTMLRASLSKIYDVTETERADFRVSFPGVLLDDGELDLMIYAGSLSGHVWMLNSPDKASVKHAMSRQWEDRLVSLEDMAKHLKLRCNPFQDNYTAAWLSQYKLSLILGTKK